MTFDELCDDLRVTADERRQMVEYLAFLRMRDTLRKLDRSK